MVLSVTVMFVASIPLLIVTMYVLSNLLVFLRNAISTQARFNAELTDHSTQPSPDSG